MIRSVIFDLDGTIIDSERLALQALLDCTKDWGMPVTAAEAATVAGKKWEVAFELLFTRYALPVARQEAEQAILQRYQELLPLQVQPVPGVVAAIRDFAAHFSLAVVSGSYRKDVLWALEHLGVRDFFPHVLGAEDYPLSKPAPDGFLKAIGLLGIPAAETLVFEDSAAGIASALAAGAKVAAVESTNHFGHDQSPAHAKVRDFTGVDSVWVRKTFS